MRFPEIRWHPPQLCFVHIMKTAGTSVEVLLQRAYGPGFTFVPLRMLNIVDPAELARYRCWRSHCGPGLIPFLPAGDLRTVTFLREPVERFVSHCHHTQRMLANPPDWVDLAQAAPLVPFAKSDLSTFLAQPESAFHDNFQTRHLGSVLHLEPWFRTGDLGRMGQRISSIDLPPALTDDSDMEQVLIRACRQIDQMDVVGITERFAESSLLLTSLLGLPPSASQPSENLNPAKQSARPDHYRSQLPPDLIDQIEYRNRYDITLYAYACERFNQQMARHREHPRRVWSLAPRLLSLTATARKAVTEPRP